MPRTARTIRRKHRRPLARAARRRVAPAEFAPVQPITSCSPPLDGPALRRLVFDEMERLREIRGLSALLERYETLAQPDRQAWQERVNDLIGLSSRELVKLHGELLAYGWIEQNTGLAAEGPGSFARPCYRIVSAGLRALKQMRADEEAAVATLAAR